MQIDALAATVLAAPARLHGTRLVCIDGRAGAGKTSLAADLTLACSAAGQVTTISMDDLYEGWSGLTGAADVVADVLVEPWRAGRPAQLAAWDWHANRRLAAVPVRLTPVVVLEGVGSWSRRYADVVSTLVWLQCDDRTRRRRAAARDGGAFDVHWDDWAADEQRVHGREQTRCAANVIIDTGAQRAVPLP